MAKKTKNASELGDGMKKNFLNADPDDGTELPEKIKDAAERAGEEIAYSPENVSSKAFLDKMIKESASFSYDVNADPLYKQYRDMYEKESSLAAKNVFGLASALTGGYGNSYAMSAVNSVVNDYVDKLADTRKELRDDAYDKHRDKMDDIYSAYKSYSEIEDREYKREQDKKDREDAAKNQAYSLAFKAADAGDYSLLQELGIDISALVKSDKEKSAEFFAKYGDYSGLESIGIDISALEKEELAEIGRLFAAYGDYSILEQLGADMGGARTEDYYNRRILEAKYREMMR